MISYLGLMVTGHLGLTLINHTKICGVVTKSTGLLFLKLVFTTFVRDFFSCPIFIYIALGQLRMGKQFTKISSNLKMGGVRVV